MQHLTVVKKPVLPVIAVRNQNQQPRDKKHEIKTIWFALLLVAGCCGGWFFRMKASKPILDAIHILVIQLLYCNGCYMGTTLAQETLLQVFKHSVLHVGQ
jgi:hypothetical protein